MNSLLMRKFYMMQNILLRETKMHTPQERNDIFEQQGDNVCLFNISFEKAFFSRTVDTLKNRNTPIVSLIMRTSCACPSINITDDTCFS
jgi:hypothetical protein